MLASYNATNNSKLEESILENYEHFERRRLGRERFSTKKFQAMNKRQQNKVLHTMWNVEDIEDNYGRDSGDDIGERKEDDAIEEVKLNKLLTDDNLPSGDDMVLHSLTAADEGDKMELLLDASFRSKLRQYLHSSYYYVKNCVW